MTDSVDSSDVQLGFQQDAKNAMGSVAQAVQSTLDSSPAAGAKQVLTEMKTAFGSPQVEQPEPPASSSATPLVNPSKQLDFGVSGGTPSTPEMTAAFGHAGLGSSDEIDYNAFITETLLWTNKVRSAFYFVAGLLAWLVVRAIFTSPTTLFTGVCYVLLFSLGLNFLRGVMAPRYQERCTWAHSAWTRFATAALSTSISAAAALHDRHLNGLDPLHTLEVGLSLWVLSLLGRVLDVVTLLLLLHLGAFSVPLAYKSQQARVDKLVKDVYSQASAQYEKVDRRIKAAAIVVLAAVLFFVLPAVDRFVALFMVLAYGRSILRPNEYAAVQKRIEPMAAAVTNAGTNATALAVNTMNKYEITPTPKKKKAI